MQDTTAPADPVLSIGETAAALAECLAKHSLFYAASDDVRAEGIARALHSLAPDDVIVFCPGSDALPGDAAPASPVNVGQRVSALRQLRLAREAKTKRRVACITTGEALARAYPPPAAFGAEPPCIAVGAPLDGAAMLAELEAIGYIADERVDEPGEVAWRGQVLDVFPADAPQPLRVEIADGKVVGLRTYDPADQRTTSECERRELGRVSEPPLGDDRTTLLDHCTDACVIVEPAAEDRRRRFLALTADTGKRAPHRAVREIVDDTAWRAALADRDTTTLDRAGDPPPRFVEKKRPVRAFTDLARTALADGDRVVLLGGERDLRFLSHRIAKALDRAIDPAADWRSAVKAKKASLLSLPLAIDRGFRRPGILAVAAADLLGSRAERDDVGPTYADTAAFDLGEIRVGDVVVHEDHGIGVVAGLEPIDDQGGDAIRLTYAKDAKRLVPVAEADRLWRYGADADAVTLDRLDGSSWQNRRGEIAAAIAESARGLTAIAAERDARTAPKLAPDTAAYERFAAGFPFTETADQAKAIEAVRTDLASGKPMDRLVVGDVGYGKTEVALRAAAVAALAGHQVAIAAPTTVLARQHLESFTRRFADTGIEVAGLSRLSSAAEKRRVKAGLKDGSIGVVVGTGAVAAKGIAYKDLALVVIDEEQRFGAADKGRLRDLSAGHVLTLSATPIPRTLQTALVGLQQLSIIATPPARRQPIRTAVGAFDDAIVRAALLREKSRGGQSFVVVPRIEDMAPLAVKLGKLVPELDLLQAHGKMPAADIDEAMVRFGNGDGDVLLATNIIEAGLDVPRANTMVIWRADRFGLSQLHQLRGRVGRGSRRGQVLLMTQPDHEIAPRTLKRLRTLEAFDRLGAGFAISARDLDMRGAGDLLGETQAGHMKLIGVDLYQQLLEAALREARGEHVERWTPELHLGIEGRIPESWVPDEELRVTLYTRLARLADDDALDRFADELEDRFGPLPPEAATLIAVSRVRAAAKTAGIVRIDAGPAAIAITPRRGTDDLAERLGLEANGDRLLLRERIEDPAARLDRLVALLDA
ncbi:transcription-repair coupling factor (superfamily II helicase) [Sphingomonas jinjuensis]|uniref:Transcription-repair-coupling factor n=1 Tax=Sphingomonas jinjuensis TaxID=535907 RepID=A0A840FBB2_9SPHN|nr:TRCF domain-containing protein [Sphingomonas jinjuensis]MBB4153932.1 transcription-repair coupling factor (superfamily II helicase) [Sphingomonas jinjuensis]